MIRWVSHFNGTLLFLGTCGHDTPPPVWYPGTLPHDTHCFFGPLIKINHTFKTFRLFKEILEEKLPCESSWLIYDFSSILIKYLALVCILLFREWNTIRYQGLKFGLPIVYLIIQNLGLDTEANLRSQSRSWTKLMSQSLGEHYYCGTVVCDKANIVVKYVWYERSMFNKRSMYLIKNWVLGL